MTLLKNFCELRHFSFASLRLVFGLITYTLVALGKRARTFSFAVVLCIFSTEKGFAKWLAISALITFLLIRLDMLVFLFYCVTLFNWIFDFWL